MKYDVFISHASEDKNSFVRPLSEHLKAFGVQVWYDEFSLKVGDSLSRSIDKGLSASNYGLVVLSPDFIKKDWPEYELRGLIAKELGKNKVILPIWHDISRDDVLAFSPPLADKLALTTSGLSPAAMALKIIEVVRPDLHEKIMRRAAFLKHQKSAVVTEIDPRKIKFGAPRHEQLPFNLLCRVRLIRAALMEVYPHSMDFWLDGFKADAHPSREIRIWEHIASCYLEFVTMTQLNHEQRKTTYLILSIKSLGANRGGLDDEFKKLPEGSEEIISNLWDYAIPPYDIEDEAFPLDYNASAEQLENMKRGDVEVFPYDIPDELVFEMLGQTPATDDN